MRPWHQTDTVFNQGAMNGAPTERRGRIYAPLASGGCGIQPGRHESRPYKNVGGAFMRPWHQTGAVFSQGAMNGALRSQPVFTFEIEIRRQARQHHQADCARIAEAPF